eukprot:gene35330-52802_t
MPATCRTCSPAVKADVLAAQSAAGELPHDDDAAPDAPGEPDSRPRSGRAWGHAAHLTSLATDATASVVMYGACAVTGSLIRKARGQTHQLS